MVELVGKPARGLVAASLMLALVVAACGSAASTSNANGANGANGGNGAGSTGGTLTSGLAANLDTLDSYQFSWQFSASSSSATAADSGSFGTSGTVVNKPTKSYKINDAGMLQIIVIGSQGWTSLDNGSTWTVDTTYSTDSSSLTAMLPTAYYGSDFDTNAGNFTVAGNETKNGVDCIHYKGNSSLGALGAVAGVAATFQSDLWVAKNGNYPVSGFYGWSASSGGQSGTWGYSFDVTHVNDAAANAITAPANAVAIPT
jgi:hypothetical protein